MTSRGGPLSVRLAESLGVSTDHLPGLSESPHRRIDHEVYLLRRSLLSLMPKDRSLLKGIIHLLSETRSS